VILSAKQKKWLHAGVMGFVTGALTAAQIAFTTGGLTQKKVAIAALVAVLCGGFARAAGAILAKIEQEPAEPAQP